MPKSKLKIKKHKKISVAFVCTGNTCRSPVAEKLFRKYLKQECKQQLFRVLSVGLAASPDCPMSILSQQVLKENKVMALAHKSKPINEKVISTTNYFICMTQGHKDWFGELENIYTIAEITGGTDVMDPFGGTIEEYKKMYDYLAYATPDILTFILDKHNKGDNTDNDSNC